ncbi:MAG: hypothetical protein KGR98_11220 [Verrucomicrobia bacterium]|nr:hypothetical protein [Verrucomicrobiota bacterium]MDE3100446.1 hypothetical protein [Verrucomicrobiota bacterium]
MSDFIAYHSVEKMERDYQPTEQFHFFSRKPDSFLRSAIGSRVWVVVGWRDGRRTLYRLVGVFTPSEVRPESDGFGIIGTGTPFHPPFEVSALPWFSDLLREQSNFSFGFSRIRGESIVAELERLLAERERKADASCNGK